MNEINPKLFNEHHFAPTPIEPQPQDQLLDKVSNQAKSILHTPTDQMNKIPSSTPTKSKLTTPIAEFIPKIDYDKDDLNNILDKLKPGDIILSYYPSNTGKVTTVIRAGQQLHKLFTQKKAFDSHNVVHAGIFSKKIDNDQGGKDGEIIEVLGHGITTSKLSGARFNLNPGASHGFIVIRPKNSNWGLDASVMASRLTKDDVTSQYAVKDAFLAGSRNTDLSRDALKRYLKGAWCALTNELPLNKEGKIDFYCSHFVSWLYQSVEANEVIATMNEMLGEKDQIRFPELQEKSAEEKGRKLEEWAHSIVQSDKHRKLLEEKIQLKFDSKHMTPQNLCGYIFTHPELFSEQFMITAKNASLDSLKTSHSTTG